MFYLIAIFLTAGITITADLLTKYFTDGLHMEIIPNVLSFVSAHNSGAGWSFLEGEAWAMVLFIVLAIIASIGIIVFELFFNNKFKNAVYGLGVGLLVGGIVGNLVDRIAMGEVRDFIHFDFMQFPIFNLADMALTFGVILIAIYMLFLYERKKKQFGKEERFFVSLKKRFVKKG